MIRPLRRRLGFTLAEILISITVISIGMLGTCAAISFGLRASTQGSRSTLAIGFSRKIIELMLTPGTAQQYAPALLATMSATVAAPNPIYGNPSVPANVNDNSPITPAASSMWRPLYDPAGATGWFAISDWVPVSETAETLKFQNDAQQFSTNVYVQVVGSSGAVVAGGTIPSYGALKDLVFVTVSVRWADKSSMKMVQTQAVSYGHLT